MNAADDAGDTLPGWTLGPRSLCCAPSSLPLAAGGDVTRCAPAGTRRRRLWDLPGSAHCPVVGVCLPMPVLRRLARKVLGVETRVDDYALHCSVVAECKHRSAIAEAVQRELDQRFSLALRQTSALKTTAALAAWWEAQHSSTDLPGALWGTLTHSRCDAALSQCVLGQVHMLQHQVGMSTRVELARFEALIDENAVLTRELAAAQQRCTRQAADNALQTAAMQADIVRLRGQRLAADSQTALLREDLQALHDAVPELDSRSRLSQRVTEQAGRIVELQRSLQAARNQVERLTARPIPDDGTELSGQAPPVSVAAPGPSDGIGEPGSAGSGASLADLAVLCVGGRSSAVPVYRRLVEACGARFEHHDGGQQHNTHQLDHTLAAADLVICQAGCISHNAYWRVKDHCKRFGKRCIFVDKPSAASLQRALAEVRAGKGIRPPAANAPELPA